MTRCLFSRPHQIIKCQFYSLTFHLFSDHHHHPLLHAPPSSTFHSHLFLLCTVFLCELSSLLRDQESPLLFIYSASFTSPQDRLFRLPSCCCWLLTLFPRSPSSLRTSFSHSFLDLASSPGACSCLFCLFLPRHKTNKTNTMHLGSYPDRDSQWLFLMGFHYYNHANLLLPANVMRLTPEPNQTQQAVIL